MDPMAPTTAQDLAANAVEQPTESGWRVGETTLHPSLTAGVTYDDNISLSQTNRQAAFIGTIAPELTGVLGNREVGGGTWLSLTYKPTFYQFSDYRINDTVDELADFKAMWSGAKLTLGVSQVYQLTHGAVIEIGQRVKQENYNTDLLAKYALSDKTSIEIGPRLYITDSPRFLNTQEWGVDGFLNYAFGPKLTGSVGGSVGYFDVQDSPKQWYERLLARGRYELATKVELTGAAGVEFRQYESSQPDSWQPVFGLAATCHPFDATTVTVEAHRREEASVLLVGQDFLSTGFTAEIRQQIWERYFVSVAGGYENRKYSATEPGIAADRTDNYCLIRTAAGATFAKYWTVQVFYQYQTDASTAAFQSFTDNQAGVEGSWGF
jgi:hypothetical protein